MLRMKSVIAIMLLFAVLLSGCVEKEQGVSNVSTEAQATPGGVESWSKVE